MKKGIIAIMSLLLISLSATAQTKVVAHRGYWTPDGSAQNSLTSLRMTHDIGAWGSEFDVSITKDGVCVVNHDPTIEGKKIETSDYKDIKNCKLKNGERLPTLKQYLKAGAKLQPTKLVLEIKPHESEVNEDRCVDEVIRLIKKTKTMPQIVFISFSKHICQRLVNLLPDATVQYLNGELSPKECKAEGFSGLDYEYKVFEKHPEWIAEAHKLGLQVNVWTVNDLEKMKTLIKQNVDFITTNKPVEAMKLTRE